MIDGVRVLVVDDNEDARQITALVLEGCGARVEQAASSREALKLMTEDTAPRWDAFVFDIAMPGADGCELMCQVRMLDAERGGNLPAIALTAHAGAQDRERALAAGFQSFLTKPVEPDELLTTIRRLAGRDEELQSRAVNY